MANWYKRDPTAFLMGTMGLTFEQKGAYSIVLDLIYEKGGAIPDNDNWIAGVMGLSARKWRTLKNDLIEAGKISIENGLISNVRADEELEKRSKLSRTRAEVGAKGGRTVNERSVSGPRTVTEPDAKPLKTNDADQAIASPPFHLEESREEESRAKKKESSASDDAVLTTKRGKRLSGNLLKGFLKFWDTFDYKRGKREAADAWLKLKPDGAMLALILDGAKREAAARPEIISAGRTPKMAEGWLSGYRWEDAGLELVTDQSTTSQALDELREEMSCM